MVPRLSLGLLTYFAMSMLGFLSGMCQTTTNLGHKLGATFEAVRFQVLQLLKELVPIPTQPPRAMIISSLWTFLHNHKMGNHRTFSCSYWQGLPGSLVNDFYTPCLLQSSRPLGFSLHSVPETNRVWAGKINDCLLDVCLSVTTFSHTLFGMEFRESNSALPSTKKSKSP